MDLFGQMATHGFGEVHVVRDQASGLRAIVAVHDTRLGPALGGCRFIHYDRDESALVDALRLARGMTYKAALAGIDHGGGNSVILRPRGHFDRVALFRAFGRFVDTLAGHYIASADSGTSLEDMEVVRGVTRHVTGVSPQNGGSGDPSPFTALGVRRGIEACVKHRYGRDSLEGLHVAVQGIGHVGLFLCRELHEKGVRLTVADVDPHKAERAHRELGAEIVPIGSIFDVECDVLSPCALGSALNDETIPRLRCKIVAGAANNQLADPRHGDALFQRGILYAPDFAIGAGGLVNVAEEVSGYDADRARERTMHVYDTILEICERSASLQLSTDRVADTMAEERLARLPESTRPS